MTQMIIVFICFMHFIVAVLIKRALSLSGRVTLARLMTWYIDGIVLAIQEIISKRVHY